LALEAAEAQTPAGSSSELEGLKNLLAQVNARLVRHESRLSKAGLEQMDEQLH
jgi:hypothetical protein